MIASSSLLVLSDVARAERRSVTSTAVFSDDAPSIVLSTIQIGFSFFSLGSDDAAASSPRAIVTCDE